LPPLTVAVGEALIVKVTGVLVSSVVSVASLMPFLSLRTDQFAGFILAF
jgi:hypothetical protein